MPFISSLEPAVFLYIMATISDGLTALGLFQSMCSFLSLEVALIFHCRKDTCSVIGLGCAYKMGLLLRQWGSSALCDVFSNLSLVLLHSTHSLYLAHALAVKRSLGACDAVHEVILFRDRVPRHP